jgi:hypothetical protein
VHHACAALTYTIAHEVGQCASRQGAGSKRFAVSLRSWLRQWYQMAGHHELQDSCGGCTRLPVWSNPSVNIMGKPAGTIDADNSRVILELAERVSRFR